MTLIKICGMTTAEDVDQAVAAGADMIGFILVPWSPRAIDLEQARSLRAHVPPGVEAIGVLSDERYQDKLPLFGGVEKVRWRRLVRPGDELVLSVTLERLSARGGWGRGRVTVEGELACEARIFFAFAG